MVQTTQKPRGLFVLPEENYRLIYSAGQVERIGELMDLITPQVEPRLVLQNPAMLAEAEIIFTGWGSLTYNAEVLAAAPKLKMVFYGAGSVRSTVTEAFWERGVRISSAWVANGVPVVEYTLAQILLCLKRAYQHASQLRAQHTWSRLAVAGGFDSTVGIISLGVIGRMLVEKLRGFDLKIIAYDPFVSAEEAAALGVELAPLDEVFQRADVVSLHTPLLDTTRGMITGELLRLMQTGATFINTSRGGVVREADLLEVLQERPDLFAVIDVTDPVEPPAADSLFYTLPNVFLTPHIAGSMDGECKRMGSTMLAELERYLAGEKLKYEISRERAVFMA